MNFIDLLIVSAICAPVFVALVVCVGKAIDLFNDYDDYNDYNK
jgi:hypothetical protein